MITTASFFVRAVTAAGILLTARAATPVDPQASREARNVLNWLDSLAARKDHKIVSGQFHQDHIDSIHAETKKWIGMLGDYLVNGRGSWLDDRRSPVIRQQMLDWWQAGGIVMVHIPIHNPKTKGIIADRNFTAEDMDAAVTPGTAINGNLNTWLDTWAVHAAWLQEHHVPLIIRPLHEMNCCFWYGNQPPAKTIALWKYIFTFLTKTKALHNLLFGYAVVEFKGNFTLCYPGNDWVDLVGIDLYTDLTGDKTLTSDDFDGYRALEGLGKPIALCEFGPKQTNKSPAEPVQADYRKLIAGVKTFGPKFVYWFSWSVKNSMRAENNAGVAELLNDPWVINRDEIPNLK